MGLIKSPTLSTEYVLSQIDESSIFYAYFGDFEFNKIYPSVFREDSNPSTGFYINNSGKIIYNDLSTSEKLDCFAFVAKKFDLTYGKAIVKVACDFGLVKCEGIKPFSIKRLSNAEKTSDLIKKHTDIKIIPDLWTDSYEQFWTQFAITRKELEENEVYPIKKLYVNGTLIPNFSKNVRFAYVLRHEDKVYKKIYTPYAVNKKFKWITNIPLYLPFGFDSLSYSSDTLLITKAQKDRIIFKKYFKDVIALQNESPAALRDKTLEYLKKRYNTIYINCDLDKAGKDAIAYYEEKGLVPLMLPDIVYEKHDIKDCADFVKAFGINRFQDFLRYKKVI